MSEASQMLPPPPYTAHWALFLDVDGTLLEHAALPDEVHVDARLMTLLGALVHAPGAAIALISGRSVADLDSLFAPLVVPAAGQHGAERRGADGVLRHQPRRLIERLAAVEAALSHVASAHEGLMVENKGLCVALHYRLAPQLQPVAEREVRAIADELGDGFEIQAGKFVLEIKPSGKDKGTAIAEFMAEAPFAGRTPVFVGDDLSDEYGFTLVNATGGHSVKVGAGVTGARWRLPDAAAVQAWLGGALRVDGLRRAGETA